MKVNLYYDVLLVPPRSILKARKESGSAVSPHYGPEYAIRTVRFLKRISLPCLLVPGQIYFWPGDWNQNFTEYPIMASGVYPDGDKHIPYMVIVDDYTLDFDHWLEYEAEDGEWKLPVAEQVKIWRAYDEPSLERAREILEAQGWEIVNNIDHPASFTHSVSLEG